MTRPAPTPTPTPTPQSEISAAYQVAARREAERVNRGATIVGRKIGYTNTQMWSAQGVNAPMWGAMYDDSVVTLGDGPARHGLAAYHGPRIEPEVVVHFSEAPPADSSIEDLIQCIDWVAHGYEIVLSLTDGAPVTAARAIGNGGMHGALLLGARRPTDELGADPVQALAGIGVELYCDGELKDTGASGNVMGSPLNAIVHLMEGLRREGHGPIRAGDLVTTGTMTGAHPIAPGQRWTTALSGTRLAGLDVTFE